MYPEEGLIYDYFFKHDPAEQICQYELWEEQYSKFVIDPKLAYHEIMIPTNDSQRNIYLTQLLLTNGHHVLCPGPSGTGKSQNIYEMLIKQMPENY